MSSETSSVIISICGIAAVVAVLVILAGFLVVRIFKTSIFSMAMMAMKIVAEPKDEPDNVQVQSLPRQKRDLHAEAKSLDFDAAVARQGGKHSTQTMRPTTTNTYSAQSVSPPNFENPSTEQYSSLDKRRRRQRAEEGEDEMDLLDAYGDEE